jgi:Uma2 family endonuclease
VVVAPGVVPTQRSEDNCLVPDLGITCAPPARARLMHEPLVLIEILSSTDVSKTRANVVGYRTIPSVTEIVVLRSSAIGGEILRRGADGAWPRQPDIVDADGELRLDSIGFAVPLRAAYRTTDLV